MFFHEVGGKIVASILDPHGHHLDDALMKLKALAMFAGTYGEAFHRIEALTEIDGKSIVVEKANGIVRARNMAGPVQVGAALGVQCESGSGGIRVTNISGAMRVSTSLGSIIASLLGGTLGDVSGFDAAFFGCPLSIGRHKPSRRFAI